MPSDFWTTPFSEQPGSRRGGLLGPARGQTAQALRAAGYDVDALLAKAEKPKRGFFSKYILGPLTYIPRLEAQLVTPTPGPWWKEFTEAAKPEAPTIGGVITGKMKRGWPRSVLATVADIALDPTTYLGAYAAKGVAGAVRAAGRGAAESLAPRLAGEGVSAFAKGAAERIATEAAQHGAGSKIVREMIEKSIGPAVHQKADAVFLARMSLEGEAAGRAVPKTAFGWGVGFGKYATIVSPEKVQAMGLGLGQAIRRAPVLGAATKMLTSHYVSPGAFTTENLLKEVGHTAFTNFEAFAEGKTQTVVELAHDFLATMGITERDYAQVFARVARGFTKDERENLLLLLNLQMPVELRQAGVAVFDRQVKEMIERAAKAGVKVDEDRVAVIMDRAKAANFSPVEAVVGLFRPEVQADALKFTEDIFPRLAEASYLAKQAPRQAGIIEAEAGRMGAALARARRVEDAVGALEEGHKPVPLWITRTLPSGRKIPIRNPAAAPLYKELRSLGATAKDVKIAFKATTLGERQQAIETVAAQLGLRSTAKVLQDATELSVLHDVPQALAIARVRGLPDTLGGLLQHIATEPIGKMREDGLIEDLSRGVLAAKQPGYEKFWAPGVRVGKAGFVGRYGEADPLSSLLPKTYRHNPLMRDYVADLWAEEARAARAAGNEGHAVKMEREAAKIRPEKDVITAVWHDFFATESNRLRRDFTNRFIALAKTPKEVKALGLSPDDWVEITNWKEFKGLLFPSEAREAFTRMAATLTFNADDISAIAKRHAQMLGLWKTVAVAGITAPRWVEANLGGNLWLMMAAGVKNPVRLMQGIVASRVPPTVEALGGVLPPEKSTTLIGRALDQLGGALGRILPDTIYAPALGRKVSLGELPSLWREAGGMKTFTQAELMKDALRPRNLNPLSPQFFWTQGVMEFNSAGELAGHMTLFADRLAKGDSIRDAVGTTKRFLFDYGDLTEWEKKWGKGVVPFYTWIRKNVALHLRMLYEQPGKPGAVAKFVRDTDLNAPEYPQELTPSWMGEVGAARGAQAGQPTYYLPQIPFLDISRTMSLRQFSGSLHPAIGYGLKRIFEKDPFTGQPVSGVQAFAETMPWISTPARMLRVPAEARRRQMRGLYMPWSPYRVDLRKTYQGLERERREAIGRLARQAEAAGRMRPTAQRLAQQRRVSRSLQRLGVSEEMME